MLYKTAHLLVFLLLCTFFTTITSIEKKFVVVICTYNNSKWVKQNLDSVRMQRYNKDLIRILIIDDGSSDETAELIEQYIEKYQLQNKITLICNKKRRRKLANLYRLLYMCDDDEIVILLDGDDWLAHSRVIEYINNVYQNPSIWFTYGQYENVPAYEARKWGFSQKGYACAVKLEEGKEPPFRKGKFPYMHLRTFYGWLFKLIKLEDLISETVPNYKGDFFPASNDMAIFIPIAEMVHNHILFIPEILYIRNLYSEIVGFKIDSDLQWNSAHEIRHKKPYTRLSEPIYRNLESYRNQSADLFIFCNNTNYNTLKKTLENIYLYTSHLGAVIVILKNNTEIPNLKKQLSQEYPEVRWVVYESHTSLKKKLVSLIKKSSNHIIFSSEDIVLEKELNIGDMIYWLERTWAHAFYAARDTSTYQEQISWLIPIDDTVSTWKFAFAKGIWRQGYDFKMTLYKKETIQNIIERCNFTEQELPETTLLSQKIELPAIGLFYQKAPAIYNTP